MRDKLDYLIMILSTDWSLPYWTEIGIDVDKTTKARIKMGCREIVASFMEGASSYYLISFGQERKHDTASKFRMLLAILNVERELGATFDEWANLTHEELNAPTWYVSLTQDAVQDRTCEGLRSLQPAIQMVLAERWRVHRFSARLFPDICQESKTDWDVYTQSLTDHADDLGIQLWIVILSHKFRSFWEDISQVLTPEQVHELKEWYKAMTISRLGEDRPDLIPPFVERPDDNS